MEPLGIQRPTVAHFKGLINAKVDLEAQGCDTTFIMGHAHLKKAILYREMAKGAAIFSSHCMYAFNFTTTIAPTHRARRYKLEPPEPEKGLTSSM